MNKGVMVLSLSLFFAMPTVFAQTTDAKEIWKEFISSSISNDGRVIDWQNKQISHSEGQGYAMVLAVFFDDKALFEKLYTWSSNNLGTKLRAWKWGQKGHLWQVLDANNATDGDILHAWGLLLAGEKWHTPSYTNAAIAILKEIREKLVTKNGLILPALHGFYDNNTITVNLSYYIFPALKDFVRFDVDNAAIWETTYKKGIELIHQTALTQKGFVPDWIECSLEGQALPVKPSAEFGYEAIRVPLYLSLAKEKNTASLFRPLVKHVSTIHYMAAQYLFDTPLTPATSEALAGYYAVLGKTAELIDMPEEAQILWSLSAQKAVEEKGNYYGTILYLMALFH